MRSRSTNSEAQTLKQAKADYKKYGPRVSSQETRRLERGAELFRRAEKIKDSERRQRAAIKKRQDKEQKERELRRSNGPSKPAASQAVLDSFVKLRPELASEEQTTLLPEIEPLNYEINATNDTVDTNDPDDMHDIDDQTMLNIRFSPNATINSVDATNPVSRTSRETSNTTTSDVQTGDSALADASGEGMAALHDLIGSISTQDVTLSPSDLKDLDFDRTEGTRPCTNIGPRSSDEDSPPTTATSPASKNRNLNMQISFTDFELSTQDLCHLVD